MKQKLTPTLALIVAGGLAAGIALARPAASEPVPTTAAVAPAPAAGFLGNGSNPEPGFLGGTPSTSAAPATAPPAIVVADFDFGDPVTVAPGAAITVTNRDGAPHTVTADSGAFDTGSIGGGASATFTAPTDPGTYTFFCAIHPSMQGELTVQG